MISPALWIAIFAAAFVLLVAAMLVERSGVRSRDYEAFERSALIAHRLMFVSLLLLPVELLLIAPLFGAALFAAIAIWSAWWYPRSRRRLEVAATAVFDADPGAVASVMFDIAGQRRWIDGLIENAIVTPGLVREGTVIRQTVLVRGHSLVARSLVTELRPYERMVLTLDLHHARPFDVFEVAPHARGSLVRYGGVHELTWVSAILSGWRAGDFRRRFTSRRAAHLERLRGLVERMPTLVNVRP